MRRLYADAASAGVEAERCKQRKGITALDALSGCACMQRLSAWVCDLLFGACPS